MDGWTKYSKEFYFPYTTATSHPSSLLSDYGGHIVFFISIQLHNIFQIIPLYFRCLFQILAALKKHCYVCVSGVLSEEPNKGVHTPWRNSKGKFASHVLRLNNNLLSNMTGLMETLSALFVEPKRLAWLDLSFNNITHIHPVNIHRY